MIMKKTTAVLKKILLHDVVFFWGSVATFFIGGGTLALKGGGVDSLKKSFNSSS